MPEPSSARTNADVVVIGAGIVGVSTALGVQRRGLSVILVDRREPGRETSYGNAGILSSGSIVPLNGPNLWASLPAYLGNQHPALRRQPGWLMENAVWTARFLANATRNSTAPRSAALDGLIRSSLALHREWIRTAGVENRLRETGWLKAWRGDGSKSAEREHATLASFGIASEVLDRQAISALEPAITPVYKVGLLHKDTGSVDSPGSVVTAYARMFAANGGTILQRGVSAIERGVGTEAWRVATAEGDIAARHVVVALGPWSPDLLKPLGLIVPMAYERGYHQEFRRGASRILSRPIHDSDNGFLMTPVENGVRITTGVELARRDAPSSLYQLDAATAAVKQVIDLGAPVGETWRGARPTLPDSLPMIGAAPRHPGLWLAFGHQHIGFSTGPGTGVAIAAMIAGVAPPFDVARFSPSRYL